MLPRSSASMVYILLPHPVPISPIPHGLGQEVTWSAFPPKQFIALLGKVLGTYVTSPSLLAFLIYEYKDDYFLSAKNFTVLKPKGFLLSYMQAYTLSFQLAEHWHKKMRMTPWHPGLCLPKHKGICPLTRAAPSSMGGFEISLYTCASFKAQNHSLHSSASEDLWWNLQILKENENFTGWAHLARVLLNQFPLFLPSVKVWPFWRLSSPTQITLSDKGSLSQESWACNFITLVLILI